MNTRKNLGINKPYISMGYSELVNTYCIICDAIARTTHYLPEEFSIDLPKRKDAPLDNNGLIAAITELERKYKSLSSIDPRSLP
jgi:hypothetical protein